MGKIRVHELAKEVGIESKVLVAKLIEEGYDVKTHNSTLDENTANDIRQKLGLLETKVEKKRIQAKGRTTIIRRRTTMVVPEKEEEAAPVEAAVAAEAESPAEETSAPHPGPVVAGEPEETAASFVEPQPEVLKKESEAVLEAPAEKPEAAAEVAPAEKEAPVAAVVETPEQSQPQPVAESEDAAEAEEISAEPETEAEAEMEEERIESEPVRAAIKAKPEKSRKGLARIIMKSAINIPVEEPFRPKAKRVVPAPPPSRGRADAAPYVKPEAAKVADKTEQDKTAAGKGKKGKRFVKFAAAEPEVGRERLARKGGGKRKGAAVVELDEVVGLSGRLSSGLKVDRGGRRLFGKKSKLAPTAAAETKAIKKRIKVYESISIADLAHRMGAKVNEIIAKLIGLGVMATLNQALDVDTATLVASEFGYEVEQGLTEEQSILNLEDQEIGGEELPRPPVVTVMGHVDHGKTSILDAIRNTDVAGGEAGGITQHIGAHYVRSASGDIVFLDTPGHEAFTEMRSRGAKVTDIVVLVVAADDGVMDQTKEAINHARAAEVPIVVAVNKIDKPGADPMRVKRELAELNLMPEDWGGQTIFCETSAKQNIGITELLDQILLQAEILELKADPKRRARGRVIEAHLHKGRGPVASILVQQGTLRVGDAVVVGHHYGKVRSIYNDKGETILEAGPSTPVEVHGLSGVPRSGDEFIAVPDEKLAKNVCAQRQLKSREASLGGATKISLDNLFERLQEAEVKELRILLRADVQGTLEAFGKAIEKLSTEVIKVKIIHQGTGAIIDSDVLLAAASDAIIIGFNVRPSVKVQEFASGQNVDIRYYNVIYHALDDIRKAMVGMLEPVYKERIIGGVEVRDIFHHPKAGAIAGCYVLTGKVERSGHVRLIRDGIVVYTGTINSLRRFKDDVKEVQTGYECGISLDNFNDIQIGDNLEVYVMDEVAAEL